MLFVYYLYVFKVVLIYFTASTVDSMSDRPIWEDLPEDLKNLRRVFLLKRVSYEPSVPVECYPRQYAKSSGYVYINYECEGFYYNVAYDLDTVKECLKMYPNDPLYQFIFKLLKGEE